MASVRSVYGRCWPALVVWLASLGVLGCGDDTQTMEPPEGPPDLSGSYQLQSFWSQLLSGGDTLTAPEVTGSFTVSQTSTTSSEAKGTFSFDIKVPAGKSGQVTELVDAGTYAVRVDGTWEQDGALGQSVGTYSLDGTTLTVRVTQPALAVSTTVWRKQ